MTTLLEVRHQVRQLLEGNWDADLGYCVPNPDTYPHLWLWDSCFHAVVWAALDDPRAVAELEATLAGQLPDGLVPHMRYGPAGPDTFLGPLAATSSLAQPPMFGHTIRVLRDHGLTVSDHALARARRGLEWLWTHRRDRDSGLLFVVHPWEAGNDHSPRWDDWGAPGRTPDDYDRAARTAWNKAVMADVSFAEDGAATWSSRFVAAPAGFNSYVAFNLRELGETTGDADLLGWADELAAAVDDRLWSSRERLWRDLGIVGGGPSELVPISDGLMGALVTADAAKAAAALEQLLDDRRFRAPFGPANVARTHQAYNPSRYWRGPAWPNISYLLWLALRRWGRHEEARDLADLTLSGAVTSGWAEYWNPETGEGLGARPQSWTGLVLPMLGD
jgi:Mannosylglycerate hydrolase MGH1-like glycoside hydrolase domain